MLSCWFPDTIYDYRPDLPPSWAEKDMCDLRKMHLSTNIRLSLTQESQHFGHLRCSTCSSYTNGLQI